MKLEAEDCPFMFAFFEACECLREAIKVSECYYMFVEPKTHRQPPVQGTLMDSFVLLFEGT